MPAVSSLLARERLLVSRIGVRAAIEYGVLARNEKADRALRRLHPRRTAYPLYLRPGSTDIRVFDQVFVEAEYECLHELADVRLIMDLGANMGCSSAYFLNRFPRAQVIAVEPAAENFALLERNMAPYRGRVRTLHAGVWSHRARLAIRDAPYRDGGEWTRQVRECGAAERGDVDGVDIATLLQESGHDRISLLKIDIEGAEAIIFASGCEPWIDKVDAIAIELHDDSVFGNATDVFFAAMAGRGFQISRSGELTICKRMPASSSPRA
jgi:FkbM family methyltransferase